jgi:hypothetical protein
MPDVSPDDLLALLTPSNVQRICSDLERLRAIEQWALDSLRLDHKPGDRVVITSPEPSNVGEGWHQYREALAPGQTGIAQEIRFNRYCNCWQVLVGLDRSWSVHTESDRTTRYWNGPASETPDGHTPPSAFDQEHHPNGRTKHFAMNVRWVRKADTGKPQDKESR